MRDGAAVGQPFCLRTLIPGHLPEGQLVTGTGNENINEVAELFVCAGRGQAVEGIQQNAVFFGIAVGNISFDPITVKGIVDGSGIGSKDIFPTAMPKKTAFCWIPSTA